MAIEHPQFEQYELGDDFIWPHYAQCLIPEGREIADQLVIGSPDVLPDPALAFLKCHESAVHVPYIDKRRAMISKVIEAHAPNYTADIIRRLGIALHDLLSETDELVPLFIVQHIIRQEGVRLTLGQGEAIIPYDGSNDPW